MTFVRLPAASKPKYVVFLIGSANAACRFNASYLKYDAWLNGSGNFVRFPARS